MRKKHHFQNCMRGFCYKNPGFNKKADLFQKFFSGGLPDLKSEMRMPLKPVLFYIA